MKRKCSSIWKLLSGLTLAIVLAVAFTGCEDSRDNESDVRISNWDNHDYIVRLRRVSDDGLIGEMVVEEGESRDFDGVEEDRYYVTITREGQDTISDRSGSFTVEDEQDVALAIDGNGNIR